MPSISRTWNCALIYVQTQELWNQVELEVGLCWLEKAHGRVMSKSLSTYFCLGKNSHFNSSVTVHSNPVINQSGPTWGTVNELETSKDSWKTQFPASCLGSCSWSGTLRHGCLCWASLQLCVWASQPSCRGTPRFRYLTIIFLPVSKTVLEPLKQWVSMHFGWLLRG